MTLQDLVVKNAEKFAKFEGKVIEITNENVFQEGNDELQNVMGSIIEEFLKPGSGIIGKENLFELLEKVRSGKKCLILPEHYSNFDYPLIIKFFKDLGEKGKELASACVAIAGIKLSETNPVISMMNNAYDTISIYPGRSLQNITDSKILEEETKKARLINLASMRLMEEFRSNGRVVVVFPTGTRYRPGKPETKKALREIDSYIRTSDYMLLLSINGNCLEISKSGDMTQDIVKEDKIILQASEVIECKSFRENIISKLDDKADKKQSVVDEIMLRLEKMHNQNL